MLYLCVMDSFLLCPVKYFPAHHFLAARLLPARTARLHFCPACFAPLSLKVQLGNLIGLRGDQEEGLDQPYLGQGRCLGFYGLGLGGVTLLPAKCSNR